jgi:hypothetical protein
METDDGPKTSFLLRGGLLLCWDHVCHPTRECPEGLRNFLPA